MTKCQRRLVMEWILGSAIILVVFAFGDSYSDRVPSWFRWVGVAAIIALRSSAGSEEKGSLRWNELSDEYPWLKVWVTVWALLFLCAAIYISLSGHRIASDEEIKCMLSALVAVIAPVAIVSEHRKYQECG